MGHFILSFGDLNRYVLRYPQPATELEHSVNQHTLEDEGHWRWYLDDLERLGLDPMRPRTAMLRELWSDTTSAARRLTYTLVALAADTPAHERIALIEVMEETGNVMFTALVKVADRLAREEGLELPFCGQLHLSREHGHTIGMDHRMLAAIAVSPSEADRIIGKVHAAFDAFEAFVGSLERYGRAGAER